MTFLCVGIMLLKPTDMKKIIYLPVILFIVSCSTKPVETTNNKTSENKTDRTEITPFKITAVILKDTIQVKTAFAKSEGGKLSMNDYNFYYGQPAFFIDQKQFSVFKNAIWTLVRDPKSKVYFQMGGAETESTKPVTYQQLRGKVCMCDSVKESSFDAKGQEVINTYWACDSTSVTNQINKIHFYESWYFNPQNNMIERETLGYSVFQYIEEKEAYKQLFMVFKDEESVKKAKKYYFDLDY